MNTRAYIPNEPLIARKQFRFQGKVYAPGTQFFPHRVSASTRQIARMYDSGLLVALNSPAGQSLLKKSETITKEVDSWEETAKEEQAVEVRLTPSAEGLIQELELTDEEIAQIEGSGKEGTITKRDVQTYMASLEEGE